MKIEDFNLCKVKVDSSGKAEITYLESVEGGFVKTHIVSSPVVCHPDLRDALNALKSPMAKGNDLLLTLPAIPPKLKDAANSLEKIFKKVDDEIIDGVTITGIALSGDDENRAMVITGKRKANHTEVAINTPKITLKGEVFGFETSLQPIIDKIIEETFEYLNNHKSAQLSILDEEGVEAEKEEAVA